MSISSHFTGVIASVSCVFEHSCFLQKTRALFCAPSLCLFSLRYFPCILFFGSCLRRGSEHPQQAFSKLMFIQDPIISHTVVAIILGSSIYLDACEYFTLFTHKIHKSFFSFILQSKVFLREWFLKAISTLAQQRHQPSNRDR